LLSFTILRGTPEPPILHDYALGTIRPTPTGSHYLVSPLYAPGGDLSCIYGACSPTTLEILTDMRTLTQTYLARWGYVSDLDPASDAQVMSYDVQLQKLYSRILQCPSSEDDIMPDWIYESCRIAALMWCRSIIHGTPLADSAQIICARNTGHDATDMTLLTALHAAVMQTNTSSCWGDMRGVFLWVCLVGGAASWPSSQTVLFENEALSPVQAWMRKCFALLSVKAAVSVPFDQTSSTIQALRTMLQVRHWTELKNHARRVS
jgi:hypothetical protein